MALPALDVPTYELTLPSTNKKVKFRPFLVKEHKVLLTLSDADEQEVSRVTKDLVDVCTFNKLKVKELPHFDIEYVFLKLRSKSIGENVEVIVNCECGNKIETSFSIEKEQKKRKNEIETNYEQYNVDMEKVKRYGSVYIICDGCTID